MIGQPHILRFCRASLAKTNLGWLKIRAEGPHSPAARSGLMAVGGRQWKGAASPVLSRTTVGSHVDSSVRTASGTERVRCLSSNYDSHIPTTAIEKFILAGKAAVGALRDPERADLVATLGDTTGPIALSSMYQRMQEDPIGLEILEEKPRISDTVKMQDLANCPEGSFGRAYYSFMNGRGFAPEERPTVRYVDDPELAYVMLRYREVHDFVHVLSGLGTTVEGEIVQKWFELLQTGLPVALLSATVGPLKLNADEQRRLLTEWVPWAVHASISVPFFMNIYYERLYQRDLEELRQELCVPPLPYGVPTQYG